MRSTSRHGQNRVAGQPRKYGVGASQFNVPKLGVAGIMPVTARKSVVPYRQVNWPTWAQIALRQRMLGKKTFISI